MRKTITILAITVLVGAALPAFAELENIEVGGSVRLRGNYISNTFTAPAPAELRLGPLRLLGRPIGGPFNPNVMSIFDWDDRGGNMKFVEHRTRLNVKADFTDEVSAFIELDSYDWWGEDFRSDYITGVDNRANSVDDLEVFQSYIEANEMFGHPLRLRIGRQEMAFGSQWLVGTGDFAFFFTGLSFDAVRLTYTDDLFTVDAWWSKVTERSPLEEDGDTDFYGLYGSYLGFEDITIDAYWMLLRDAASIPGPGDYDVTYLHTVGLRGAGAIGAFDFDAELSYQFGEADQIGATFRPWLWPFGDDGADFDTWGGRVEAGYTFDWQSNPRVFLGLIYLGGEDNRDISFWEWLNPFDKPDASISFNRLFSNQIYSGAMDLNNDLSNALIVRGGVNGAITEKLGGVLCVSYFEVLEDFRQPYLPILSFWTYDNDDYLGLETTLFLTYQYSEDLCFEFGWAHLFTGDGAEQGNFCRWNGLLFIGGTDDDDADYVYLGSRLKF